MNRDKELKGRMALNRLVAVLSLMGALICLHYVGVESGWARFAWGMACGFACSVTINRTLKASVYAAALLADHLVTETRKAHR